VLTFESLLEAWDGETAVIHRDRESGAWIFVCLHSTRRGPAGGGTRLKVYGTRAEALQDAMRLSAAMTRKLAIAGLPLGGGKAVIAVPEIPSGEPRRALFQRYGDLIASLGGTYQTSSDMNTGEADMDVVGERTRYVFGRSVQAGGAGSPATPTAVGVYHGIRASLDHSLGSDDLRGRVVIVQGAGGVGSPLAGLLADGGASVLVTDLDPSRANAVAVRVGGTALDADQVFDVDCDVEPTCCRGAGSSMHRTTSSTPAAPSPSSASSSSAGPAPRSTQASPGSATRSGRPTPVPTPSGSRPRQPPMCWPRSG